MSFASIDLQLKESTPKFWLCRPNRKVIHPLNDVYDKKLSVKIGIHELSFTFPTLVLRNNEFVKNPLLDKVKGHYLIKMVMNGKTEYFTIVKQSKSFSDGDEYVSVQCFSDGYELNQRYIRSVEETAKSLRELVNMFLSESTWTIDYIDGDVELLRRSYETSASTVLQAIFDVADKFNCVVEFDTLNKKLSFKKYDNIGINRGITAKEGKYLESFNLEINDENVVTRLVAYGQDGLTFRSLSPTGVNYIQDFSWFMYPFECDANYNVIKSSNYMSDNLCIALTKYQKLLETVGTTFNNLKTQRTNKQSQITVANNELTDLESDLKSINNQIDVLNYTYGNSASSKPEHKTAVTNRNAKIVQITNKKNQITTLENELSTVQTNINNLGVQLDVNNVENFTQEELDELTYYVRESEYTNDSIIDEEDLLEEANLVFEDYKQPPLSLSISLDAFVDYFDTKLINVIGLGDTIKLKSKNLNVEVKAKITQIDYDFDNQSVNLTVSNVRGLMNDDDLFAKDLNNAINTSNTVNLDKYKWKQGEYANTLVNQILTSEYDTAKNVLKGGTANTVEINERGLYNRDYNDSNTYMVVNNGILAITPDNGNTVSVAISKNGVHAERVVGKLIMGNQLVVESNSGILESNGTTTTIYDANKTKRIELGQYSLNGTTKYGLKIENGAIDIVGGLTESNLSQSVNNKLAEANGLRADLRLTAPLPTSLKLDANGITAYTADSSKFARLDYRGLYVQGGAIDIRTSGSSNQGVIFNGSGISAYNSSGTRTFYVDTNGNLTANSGTFGGTLNSAGGTFTGTLSAVNGTFRGTLDAVSGTFNKLTSGTIEGATIKGSYIDGGNINVTNGITIGNFIDLGTQNSTTRKSINFNVWSSIISNGTTMDLFSQNRVSLNAYTVEINGDTTFMGGDVDFGLVNVYGIDEVANAGYADVAYRANYLNNYDEDDFVKSDTIGLSLGYSSASDRLYFRRNGTNLGYIDFGTGTVG